MKQFFLIVSVSLAAASVTAQKPMKTGGVKPAHAAAAVAKADTTRPKVAPAFLKSALDSFSYALGMNIGNNLKQQKIEQINMAAMSKAMDDVFKKKVCGMTDQEANTVIQKKLQANSAAKSDEEKTTGRTFLASNKKRAGVITLKSGLQYEVITKGDSTSGTPKLQDTVVAHYAGSLINGKEFDNSYKRGEPLTIPVGGVIKGWTEALQLMHIGDKWKVFIPSDLGYGDRGAGADIPGGATLIFEMELLGIKPAASAPAAEKK